MPINKKFKQPFVKHGRYYNYEGEPSHGFLYHTVRIWLRSLLYRKNHPTIAPHNWEVTSLHKPTSLQPRITWIGHSTFLIQIGGVNILTDPIFGNASPFFKRIVQPAIALDKLPRIDVILISHNHWDHMHGPTLRKLLPEIPNAHVLVPEGDERWFSKHRLKGVYGSTWGQKQYVYVEHFSPSISKNVATRLVFTFLPAHHWSQRGLFDRNKSLWGSWMIECNGYTFYFAGDTAYTDHFKEIAQDFPTIDSAFLPIGPCEPHEWMKNTHMNAEQAGQAFLDLKAQHFIPMHWGTFNFGHDDFHHPLERIDAWWQNNTQALTNKTFHTLRIGQTIEFEDRLPLIQPISRILEYR